MIKTLQIKIKAKEDCHDLPIPSYATSGSSGLDLYADLKEPLNIKPGEIKLVSAGFYMSIPLGFEAQIRPRSGLALKHGITLVNAPGTIDADYRGLIQVIIANIGANDYTFKRGDRIAQMVFSEVAQATLVCVDALEKTVRDQGGFGHTGT